jgi:hypothetical protein
MDTLAYTFNSALVAIFDFIFFPLQGLGASWSLSLISIAFGPLVVLAVGRLSNQESIARVRQSIFAKLLGLRLFQSDLGVMLGIQGGILADLLRYSGLWLKPAVLLLIPFCFVALQLNGRYAINGVAVGDAAIVKVHTLETTGPARGSVWLTASEDEVSIETAAIHIPSQREIVWRVRPRSEGVHRMIVHVGDFEIEKSLVAGSVPGLLSSVRTGRGALDLLLHPGERPIEASAPLAAIEVVYPEAEFSVLGIRTHWVYPFLLLSMASGYLAKGMLGVEI